jgi:hypothetical protein
MLSLNIISFILLSHLLSDFVLQSRNQGRKKSTNIFWLLTHVLIYSSTITFFWWLIDLNYEIKNIINYTSIFFVIFITHGMTDYITSKLSGFAYLKMQDSNKRINEFWEWIFWLIIGVDQTIHIISLFWIYLIFN